MPSLLTSSFVSKPGENLSAKDVYDVVDTTDLRAKGTSTGLTTTDTIKVDAPAVDNTVPEELVEEPGYLSKRVVKNGVTVSTIPGDPNSPLPKISKPAPQGVDFALIQKEINKLPPEFSDLLKDGLENPEQQNLLMSGAGLLNKASTKADFTSHIKDWASSSGIDINRNCALLGLAAGLLAGGSSNSLAQFLVLLALLAKLLECAITDSVKPVIEMVPDKNLRESLTVFTAGKVLNPLNEAKKDASRSYSQFVRTSSTRRTISKRLESSKRPFSYSPTRVSRPGVADFRQNGSNITDMEVIAREGFDLDLLIDISQYTSPSVLMDAYPNLVSDILKYYRFPKDKEYTLESEYTKLEGYLSQLNPTWYGYERNGVLVGDFSKFTNASIDAIYLFSNYSLSTHKQEALMAKSYTETSVKTLLSNTYPYLAI